MKKISTLVIEPNKDLIAPYLHLSKTYTITRVDSLQTAFECLLDSPPKLVLLSVSYPKIDLVDFLIELKCISRYELIPLIFVLDFSEHLNFIPGTSWGGQLGLLHNLSSRREVNATLHRILSET
ncbi:MAG: hypothetical protein ABFQ62_03290 [Patescibacteria group bacterium]